MTGPADGDRGVAEDSTAVEVTLFEVDVDDTLDRDGEAPSAPILGVEEGADIEQQAAALEAANAGRPPGEQISTDPEKAN
jgi:hypothetical protein